MNQPALSSRVLTRRHLLGLMILSPLIPVAASANTPASGNTAITIPDVLLVDSEGTEHHLKALVAEQPVAISFFFTRCSTACSVQTALFKQVQKNMLQHQKTKGLLLSISLDPDNDTPDSMRVYAEKFNAQLGLEQQWLMLTGERKALEAVWKVFDTEVNQPEAHASVFWVGSVKKQRWSRLIGLPSASQLLVLLEANRG